MVAEQLRPVPMEVIWVPEQDVLSLNTMLMGKLYAGLILASYC